MSAKLKVRPINFLVDILCFSTGGRNFNENQLQVHWTDRCVLGENLLAYTAYHSSRWQKANDTLPLGETSRVEAKKELASEAALSRQTRGATN